MCWFFMNDKATLLQSGPPTILKRLKKLAERSIKLLFVLDKDTINNVCVGLAAISVLGVCVICWMVLLFVVGWCC